MSERPSIVSEKTLLPLGLFIILSAAMVTVGIGIATVSTLVKQVDGLTKDMIAVRIRLGIPPNREVVAAQGETILASPDAISLWLSRPRPAPRRAAANPQ